MDPSTPFIRRPVATTLLTFGLAAAGVVAFFKLPVSPLPQVDFPTISVQATLPGASPQDVATTLDHEGIKNRIVIVSACFSGTFVPALANDDTIVLTASDAKNPSFGCAPERDWTYFGDALFRQGIRLGRDFQQAFDSARMLIQGWELMDRARPSNPQAHFGAAGGAKLAPLFEAQRAGN